MEGLEHVWAAARAAVRSLGIFVARVSQIGLPIVLIVGPFAGGGVCSVLFVSTIRMLYYAIRGLISVGVESAGSALVIIRERSPARAESTGRAGHRDRGGNDG